MSVEDRWLDDQRGWLKRGIIDSLRRGPARVIDDAPALEWSCPAYLGAALDGYVRLRGHLRAVNGNGQRNTQGLRLRFDLGGRADIIRAYLASPETRPLMTVLGEDLRRIYADRRLRLQGGSPKRARARDLHGWIRHVGEAVAAAFGRRRRRPGKVPRLPPLSTLLPDHSMDDKADQFTRGLLALLTAADRTPKSLVAIGDYVRAARFAENNPARDRKAVAAIFESDASAAMLLARTGLAGIDLFGLEPFVFHQAAQLVARVGDDGSTRSLCARFLERQPDDAPNSKDVLALAWRAELRMGNPAQAERLTERWLLVDRASPRARIASAIARSGRDPQAALAALLGLVARGEQLTSAGSVVAAGLLADTGRLDAAEQIVRTAKAGARSRERDELLFALHGIYVRRGTPINSLRPLFGGLGVDIRWTRFVPEEIVDLGPVPQSDETARATVVLPLDASSADPRHTAASILAQSFGSLRLLVVHDGTTAAVRAAIAVIQQSDRRVQVLDLAIGAGGRVSLDAVTTELRGRYVAVARAGDFWLPDAVATLIGTLRTQAGRSAALAWRVETTPDGTARVDLAGEQLQRSPVAALFSTTAFASFVQGQHDRQRVDLAGLLNDIGPGRIALSERLLVIGNAPSGDDLTDSDRAADLRAA